MIESECTEHGAPLKRSDEHEQRELVDLDVMIVKE